MVGAITASNMLRLRVWARSSKQRIAYKSASGCAVITHLARSFLSRYQATIVNIS